MHAGLAVISVMLVTTCLTSLVMILCWHKPPILALAFLVFFGSIEALYFSASLIKFLEGAWLPILLALILMSVMFIWHYATIKKYESDLHNKVSLDWLLALAPNLGIVRVPGVGLVYTDLVSGIPSNFFRFVTTLPAFHRVLVFLCVKSVPVPHVPPAERYLVGRVGPPSHRSYRCIVRYGYRDVHQDVDSFEYELISRLSDFIKLESAYQRPRESNEEALAVIGSKEDDTPPVNRKKVRFLVEDNANFELGNAVKEELEDLMEAREAGVAFILGHSHVKAKSGSSLLKKVAIDFIYNFLKRNCRGPEVALHVPPASLLEIGMVYVL